ncbi:MAG: ABC transporter substrate-binding protein [Gammaproteobacteria bacterium]|nr:ABC transporter substrate-binding protein [Gammaproteobacteria bacterium]
MKTTFLYFILLLICNLSLIGCQQQNAPIKVGILHSLTGTMAISEKSVVDATQLAIKEINASGGILGRSIESVIIDGKSDWPSFAAGAETLIKNEQVSVIFGCWTSASRKEVKKVVEEYDHLLFYPVPYEGLEQSPNIIYTGASPNQQLTPAVKWSFNNLGKRFFLASSDYIYPHAANIIMKRQIAALGGEVVGEYYLPLGSTNVGAMISAIDKSNADVILNTISGDSNINFFQQFAELTKKIPVMSFSIAEDELLSLDIKNMVGHYAAWNYFQSVKTDDNQRFVANFKQEYGANRTTNASMEAAYSSVHLWAKTVRIAKSSDPALVRAAVKGATYNSPEGKVTVSATNNHLWKPLHIGQIQSDGQFNIIWSTDKPIRPMPYPLYKSKEEWNKYLHDLYLGWDKTWAAPIIEGNKIKLSLHNQLITNDGKI